MNSEPLNENSYSVVRLDGNEENNVSLDTIKEWYFKKQINESSLVFSAEIGQWRMLKKVFDLTAFKSEFSTISNENNAGNRRTEAAFVAPVHNPAETLPFVENFSVNAAGYGNHGTYNSPGYGNYAPPPPKKKSRIGWLMLPVVVLFGFAVLFSATKDILRSSKNARMFNEMKKFELPSNQFADSQSPVKITLPAGWKQYSPDNPYIKEKTARMVALDAKGNRVAQLTVHPFPQKMSFNSLQFEQILVESMDKLEPRLKSEDASYKTIAVSSTYIGDQVAKRVIFERNSSEPGKKVKGQMVITMDNQNVYVLEMWCEEDDFQEGTKDFTQFESNFSIK